jgi:hypothetical protein
MSQLLSHSRPGALPPTQLEPERSTQCLPGLLIWTGLTKAEAEELLDHLEVTGSPPAEVSLDGRWFTVRCG